MHRIDSQGRPYNELTRGGVPLYNVPLDTSQFQFDSASIRLRSAAEARPDSDEAGLLLEARLVEVPHETDVVTLAGVHFVLYGDDAGPEEPLADVVAEIDERPDGHFETIVPAPEGAVAAVRLRVQALYHNTMPDGARGTLGPYGGACDESGRYRVENAGEVLRVELAGE